MKHSKALSGSPQAPHQFTLLSKALLLDTSPNSNTNSNIFATNLFYEPTSVLDPHLTSSPATAPTPAPAAGVGDLPLLSWGAGGDAHHRLPSDDDWDPASCWFLPERYDPSPFPDDANPSFLDSPFDFPLDLFAAADPGPGFDRSQLDSLVRAAHCLESNDFATAHVILSRLNHNLPSAAASPLQRAVFLFKEALLGLLRPSTAEPPLSAEEIVRHIAAHKAFADLSPIPHFAIVTATQALIEALDEGARSFHLIDFDLGLGAQWSSFAQELAVRSRASRSTPPTVLITAVVVEESGETALAADNLRDFARSLNISLSVNFVRVGGLGTLTLSDVRLAGAGQSAAVVLTPSIFRLLSGGGGPESIAALFGFVRRASPRVVVFVDTDDGAGAHPEPSLRRTVAAGVEHYAAVLESVVAAAAETGAGDEAAQRVAWEVMRPRVAGAVGGWAGRLGPWPEVFAGPGWAPVPLSEFAESQAEWLVQRAPADGYHVARRDGALVMSWKGRGLASTSSWRC